jgi:hypothetical protein
MKRPIFLYILAVLLPLIGWAQERQMLSLPNREQLSSERVMEVMQDSEEFLWYATQGGGVCRDDGRQMLVFRSGSRFIVTAGNFTDAAATMSVALSGKYLNITTQPHSFNTNIIGK